MFRSVHLAESEIGLLFRDSRFERVLTPGRHRFFDPLGRVRVHRFAVVRRELDAEWHHLADLVAAANPAQADALFAVVACGPDEAAIVSMDGVQTTIVRPLTRRVFWRAMTRIDVDPVDLATTLIVDQRHRRLVEQTTPPVSVRALVHPYEAGVLFVDGAVGAVLKVGNAAFWTLRSTVEMRKLDLRAQALEVTAQELLTRDRVSVRVTLTCFYRITDPLRLVTSTADHAAVLHRLVQFAIRGSLAGRTLDEALDARAALDDELLAAVRAELGETGLAVDSVNVKDMILPGEMRAILNRVVEAEKAAQANGIRRREETAATRSALNTARLMDDNPTLLRLKELETLERLMEKVERIDFHAGAEGLDGLLDGLLRRRQGTSPVPFVERGREKGSEQERL